MRGPEPRITDVRRGLPFAKKLLRIEVGPIWIVGEVADAQELAALKPDMGALAAFTIDHEATGITVFAPSGEKQTAMHVRSFAPAHGIPEDPVCGTGNLAVAHYLKQTNSLKRFGERYIARQGMQMGRDGRVHVRVTRTACASAAAPSPASRARCGSTASRSRSPQCFRISARARSRSRSTAFQSSPSGAIGAREGRGDRGAPRIPGLVAQHRAHAAQRHRHHRDAGLRRDLERPGAERHQAAVAHQRALGEDDERDAVPGGLHQLRRRARRSSARRSARRTPRPVPSPARG